jgi:hypothetical protein
MLKPNEEVTPETIYESAAIPSEMEMDIDGLDMHSAKDFRTFVVFFFLVKILKILPIILYCLIKSFKCCL